MKKTFEIEVEDIPEFFCPVTGCKIYDEDEGYEFSKATLFIYSDVVGDFTYIHPSVEKEMEEINRRFEEENIDLKEEIEKLLSNRNLIELNFNSSGMTCGPVSDTTTVLIDADWKPNDTQENQD